MAMEYNYANTLQMLSESNFIENERDLVSLLDAERAFSYLMAHEHLTTTVIKEVHALLMKNKTLEPKYIGDWRDIPVWIGGEYKAQPKVVIQSLMQDFCDMINLQPANVLEMHVKFENIHPFMDGNGRIGRMLMNWHSIKRGEGILLFTEANKDEVYYPIFDYRLQSHSHAIKRLREGTA